MSHVYGVGIHRQTVASHQTIWHLRVEKRVVGLVHLVDDVSDKPNVPRQISLVVREASCLVFDNLGRNSDESPLQPDGCHLNGKVAC